ncbi:MAG: hypothetical protein GY761_06980 [Hyphomicrobiales bacterium]|nr:hypothetical protein [Hyphomicrobiales bacterium]
MNRLLQQELSPKIQVPDEFDEQPAAFGARQDSQVKVPLKSEAGGNTAPDKNIFKLST